MTTPRTMSAWLSNLLTVPGRSLYIHDAGMEGGLIEALAEHDIPHKGVVLTAGNLRLPWEPDTPDIAIVGDVEAIVDSTNRLFGRNMEAQVRGAHQRLVESGSPVYDIERMDDWIVGVYERCTGLGFDPVRYAAMKNLWIESQFAAGLKAGQVDMKGLIPLAMALRGDTGADRGMFTSDQSTQAADNGGAASTASEEAGGD